MLLGRVEPQVIIHELHHGGSVATGGKFHYLAVNEIVIDIACRAIEKVDAHMTIFIQFTLIMLIDEHHVIFIGHPVTLHIIGCKPFVCNQPDRQHRQAFYQSLRSAFGCLDYDFA